MALRCSANKKEIVEYLRDLADQVEESHIMQDFTMLMFAYGKTVSLSEFQKRGPGKDGCSVVVHFPGGSDEKLLEKLQKRCKGHQ